MNPNDDLRGKDRAEAPRAQIIDLVRALKDSLKVESRSRIEEDRAEIPPAEAVEGLR